MPRPWSPERATKISHGNTARFAREHGDETLGKICGMIAADEGRHEIAYQRIIDEVLKRDTDGAVIAFADMMKKQIVMPAYMMAGRGGRVRQALTRHPPSVTCHPVHPRFLSEASPL